MGKVINKKPEGVKFNIRIKLNIENEIYTEIEPTIFGVLNICVYDYRTYYTLLDYSNYQIFTISNDYILGDIEYVDMFYGRVDG